MIEPTINSFLMYFFIVWSSNILLNFLYVAKRYIPRTKKLDASIDFGFKWKGYRLLGESTTVAGLILCLVASFILYIFLSSFVFWSIPILVYLGHTLGSFIKRRMHKKDGEFVPFVDHGDYVIFTGVVFLLCREITFSFFISSVLLTYLLHPIACYIAFKLKLREYPY